MNAPAFSTDEAGGLRRLLLIGLALNALLVLPAWWRDGALSVWIVPEAWLVPLLLSLGPFRVIGSLRVALAGLLAFVIVAGLFNGLVQSVLSRPLNVFIDPLMLQAGFHLVEGSFGLAAALACSVLVALAAAGIVRGVERLLKHATRVPAPSGRLASAAAGLLVLAWLGLPGAIESQTARLAAEQWRALEQTGAARRRLVEAEDHRGFEARALPGLAGRDVYVVFVESYGVTVFDDPRYRPAFGPRLAPWRSRLEASGLSVLSSRLQAPIRGGQSWLSHATLLSGLSIDNQLWYRMLLERDIDLLTDDFGATGHTTVNVAPAIVRDWPEGRQLGFDRIVAADDLDYEGPALGWVTMPDEFTLHAFGGRIRPQLSGAVFAQFALISSHWPWRPLLTLTEQPGQIGDGRVYAAQSFSADLTVFEQFDLARLRHDYAESLGYSLSAVWAWAGRTLPEDALLIVLGDHQPVSLVTGRAASAGVPIHVVSGDEELLAPFARAGFAPGLDTDDSPPVAGLDDVRRWLREWFGD